MTWRIADPFVRMRSHTRLGSGGVAVFVSIWLAACSVVSPGPSPTSIRVAGVPPQLTDLAAATVEIGDLELTVAVADTPATRARGLMEVADLGPLDGMVFVYPASTDTPFHMRNVPIPLDIAFVSEDGAVLAVKQMSVCAAAPCPSYSSPTPFRWAVETPAGDLASVQAGDRFVLPP
jgi:uncharacterized membrane protein (UPF0127 family)